VLNPEAPCDDQGAKRATGKKISRPERVMATKAIRRFAAHRTESGLMAEMADLLADLTKALFDSYRPELHYMRGPGPKWHAKHDPAPPAFDAVAVAALIRVHVKR
jgi:hypothetical protein